MAFHTHRPGGPVCIHPTKKVCEDAYVDWQAMQMVLMAWKIAERGETKPYRKDKDVFGQLVRVIAGEQGDIMNDEGNASQNPWAKRLRAAMARAKAGDLPGYNLYTLAPTVAPT